MAIESLNVQYVSKFRAGLFAWWKKNKRSFPWRETNDGYKVLLAEVLLHRTNANQVIPVYQQVMQEFPTIKDLADGRNSKLNQILFPLGLHWRNKMLLEMSKEITSKYNGIIPQNFDELSSLPGVSHYIASATRCFAFGFLPDVLLDTNTVRITGRILGLTITDGSRRSVLFRSVLERLIDTKRARDFNWAMLDFAALVCKSKNPEHSFCPFTKYCQYYLQYKHET